MITLNCKGKLIEWNHPVVMGIINTTPDSFFGQSRKTSIDEAILQAEIMLEQGAAILDLGGQSTRPGSKQIKADEEAARVVPVIAAIHQRFPEALISVDTYYASVAEAAVSAGARMVNDVSAGLVDETMLNMVGSLKVPYVCMHMQGRPHEMSANPHYGSITADLIDFFIGRLLACKKAGIHDVIIDPGFGFGKTIEQQFTLLREMDRLRILNKPVLLGVSRKSMIHKTLGILPEFALNGTTVIHTIGLLNGANILRVHDVKEAVETIRLIEVMKQQ